MARGSQSYEGRVPPAQGTGPKNLAKTATAATNQVSAPRSPGVKSPARPRTGTAKAGPSGVRPPGGGASGVPRSTTPLASANPKVVTKPKSSMKTKGSRLGSPRADFPSQI